MVVDRKLSLAALGATIRALREDCQISLAELSQLSHCNETSLQAVEEGLKPLNSSQLSGVASALKTTPQEILIYAERGCTIASLARALAAGHKTQHRSDSGND